MPALPRPASGPGSRYTARAALTRPRPTSVRHRTDPAALTRSLTARDLWITAMVHEHRVLTTTQIARIAFTSQRSAQRRLRVLHHHAVLDSFRPLTQHGSAPEHYTLGPTGVSVIAAHAACEPATLGWRPTTIGRIAYSPSLGHDIGVNELLTHLAAPTPNATHSRLTLWLSERSCARRWDDMIRPDAYAHWHDPDPITTDADNPVLLPFFLEYDTGSQPLPRVEAKLAGYAAFTTSTNTRPALLIHTRTASRDRATPRGRPHHANHHQHHNHPQPTRPPSAIRRHHRRMGRTEQPTRHHQHHPRPGRRYRPVHHDQGPPPPRTDRPRPPRERRSRWQRPPRQLLVPHTHAHTRP
ncbi:MULTISPECIES: replication-relaxation family protein [Streptomyces]|uniref:replication-relaxation family protein n=1 Tax=Streptomyces TaxID=1883 RepID=UPI000AF19FBD|nr:replication-relaxation family protein [Streptomyces melanosporofaciens]